MIDGNALAEWAARRLALYFAAAFVSGALFVGGAALYAFMR